tara:strand:+ start:985 stop:1806 length:822 start_codon:yes stop_codon:yes gene_type:complete
MKIHFYLLIFLFFLVSCSEKKKEIVFIEGDIREQMFQAYKEGMSHLSQGQNLLAAKKFNDAEIFYPQSVWASKSAIMAAYSYYSQNYYSDAIYEINRYFEKYPNDKNLVYAHYLKAMCYFEQVEDEKKNFASINGAKKELEYIVQNYPNTDFALDSKYKLDLINSVLASKEIYLGRYYMQRKKWVASINRFKYVVNNYDTTVYAPEALHRLVELYYILGYVEESKKYAKILGYNYKSDRWYKETYKIYNENYIDPIQDIKEKKGIIKKFKSLF